MTHYRRSPDIFLTGNEIIKMQDNEVIGVNRIAIHSRIAMLQVQCSTDKEAIAILYKAAREISEKEKKLIGFALWGTKMTVKDVKRAFGDLDNMSKTAFRKIRE